MILSIYKRTFFFQETDFLNHMDKLQPFLLELVSVPIVRGQKQSYSAEEHSLISLLMKPWVNPDSVNELIHKQY